MSKHCVGDKFYQWGECEPEAYQQMINARNLPVSVAGALMADAHLGYGLPIGGVLACDNAVIPYAVGVDIACRVKLSVFDCEPDRFDFSRDGKLSHAISAETRFGIGAEFHHKKNHPVMDDESWSINEFVFSLKDKAWKQLGSSGGGNHFVEFGIIETNNLGRKLALLSHSGSRGTGFAICNYYSKIAEQVCANEDKHLSWLDLNSDAGAEYWEAMQLMGRYASANHQLIHEDIAKYLGLEIIAGVENHHNFAWKEKVVVSDERDNPADIIMEAIVHRKGATPAGSSIPGVIPGTMSSPTFVVIGKGVKESLNSSSHGAGRAMSRNKARKLFTWDKTLSELKDRAVTLLSGGLDEVHGAYKSIHQVMKDQEDLVEVVGTFYPRLVKMSGGRGED